MLQKSDERVRHGDVDVLALAGALVVEQGVHDALDQIHAGDGIAESYAAAGGRAAFFIGEACDGHQAALGLR